MTIPTTLASWAVPEADPTRPAAPREPRLRIDNIQGNILGGFNKDHQVFLFLRLLRGKSAPPHIDAFRGWLARLAPWVASAEEVLAFNRLFKAVRRRRKQDTRTVQATWINIGLSFAALRALSDDAERFSDPAFRAGMAARAVSELADPEVTSAEGNPANWYFGGPGKEVDVVLLVASDDPSDLEYQVKQLERDIGGTTEGSAKRSGLELIHRQDAATLPPPLTGHEHFGFLDGVSQPGLRGRLSDDERDLLTPRQNPDDQNQGLPGQNLVWPGEFVFGYVKQMGIGSAPHEPGRVAGDGTPVWARDGSFLVIRRLRQDVPGFQDFVEEQARLASASGPPISAEELGAKLVGRWKSGAPLARTPNRDDQKLGGNDCANNHFAFQAATPKIGPAHAQCSDGEFDAAPGDPMGARCPFSAHIRKANPRDDKGSFQPQLGTASTQTHRLLRRGIPFGAPYLAAMRDGVNEDNGDRGLMFVAYQTSIEHQFEFIQKFWANEPAFKDAPFSGHDLLIGQTNRGSDPEHPKHAMDRSRRSVVNVGGRDIDVVAPRDWVIPTGGGYFFAPSIRALYELARVRVPPELAR